MTVRKAPAAAPSLPHVSATWGTLFHPDDMAAIIAAPGLPPRPSCDPERVRGLLNKAFDDATLRYMLNERPLRADKGEVTAAPSNMRVMAVNVAATARQLLLALGLDADPASYAARSGAPSRRPVAALEHAKRHYLNARSARPDWAIGALVKWNAPPGAREKADALHRAWTEAAADLPMPSPSVALMRERAGADAMLDGLPSALTLLLALADAMAHTYTVEPQSGRKPNDANRALWNGLIAAWQASFAASAASGDRSEADPRARWIATIVDIAKARCANGKNTEVGNMARKIPVAAVSRCDGLQRALRDRKTEEKVNP